MKILNQNSNTLLLTSTIIGFGAAKRDIQLLQEKNILSYLLQSFNVFANLQAQTHQSETL
jgi:hypothetical protein